MNAPPDIDQGELDMFGRRRNDAEGASMEAQDMPGDAPRHEDAKADAPLDVPSREPPPPAAAPAAVANARPARRVASPHAEPVRRISPGADSEGKCLVVGRSIALTGQIKSCEKLIVEGSVETQMDGCRELEVARDGIFKGDADVETADISGTVEGSLTAREILIVRASGRIRGRISYGEIEIERGGTVVGEVRPCSEGDSREAAPTLAADSPAG